MAEYTGELAALGTAFLFGMGSLLFTLAGRELGSPLVTRGRLLIGIFFIMVLHWLTLGQLLPLDAPLESWWWLGFSGFIGLVIGDALLFQAFLVIGPRLSMLIMALAPVITTLMAWLFLGETLERQELLGIALTVSGVAWVVAEQEPNDLQVTRRTYMMGVLFAFGGAVGQAAGLVTAKPGLPEGFPALSGILIRFLVATIVIWTLTTLRGQTPADFRTLKNNPRALRILVIGTCFGAVIAVWLSLIAVQNARSVGIVSTLSALSPVFLLPITYIAFREPITKRAVLGTLIAFAGTALLFL